MVRRIAWHLSLLVGVAACGSPAAPVPASAPLEDATKAVLAFQRVEDDVLRQLAAVDRRVALRARMEPREEDLRAVTMGSLLAEDPSLAVIDGTVDPFSFEARARGLGAVRAKLDAAPLGLPVRAAGPVSAPALEREVLGRLVDAELVRLDEERALPRSGSALVRGLVDTWRAPQSPEQAAERDRWLARRIHEMLTTITAPARSSTDRSGALDVVRARELDDTLDALEHAIDAAGLVQATAELVLLRQALEAQGARPAAHTASDWPTLERGIKAHLGLSFSPDALDGRLSAIETELATAATRAIAKAHVSADVAESKASPLVFARTPCTHAVPGSRVRSMAPPAERVAACHLRRIVTSITDDASRAVALIVLHDHATVARWAFDVARGTATIAQTTAKHRPLSSPGPEVIAKWERMALAQPTAAIGGGVAAGLLYGAGNLDARAQAWLDLGDVPIDIAEREIKGSAPGQREIGP